MAAVRDFIQTSRIAGREDLQVALRLAAAAVVAGPRYALHLAAGRPLRLRAACGGGSGSGVGSGGGAVFVLGLVHLDSISTSLRLRLCSLDRTKQNIHGFGCDFDCATARWCFSTLVDAPSTPS